MNHSDHLPKTHPNGLIFIRFDADRVQVERRILRTSIEVADVLADADFGYWIQTVGEPQTYNDVRQWRAMGRFLQDILKAPVPSPEINLDGTHV